MQTATRPVKPRNFFASDAQYATTFGGHQIDSQADGTSIVRDVPVFKVGTFRDSMGDQHTWTAEHLQQMVNNFDTLKAFDKFPNVPVRRDHSSSIDKVIGYFESVRTDGSLLYGDFHITDSSAVSKLSRGTYRSVSLEVGMFVANDEAAYWPAIYGVAYVDIPAVEGLHNKNLTIGYFSRMVEPKEIPMGTENTSTGTPSPVTVNFNGTPTTPSQTGTPTPGTPAAPAPAVRLAFRLAGKDEFDFAKVQSYIVSLETKNATLRGFQRDTQKNSRIDFVKSLVKDGKIGGPQEEGLVDMVTGDDFTDSQFDKFKASYEKATKLAIFEQHGASNGEPGSNAPGTFDAVKDEREVLTGILDMHRRSGMDADKIEKTATWKRLAHLNANKS